jgi:peptidyl-prolyl cis-trans isomerase C
MLRSGQTRTLLGYATILFIGLTPGCHRKVPKHDEKPPIVTKPAQGLTKEQAEQVLARVGDKTITLGDYAAALERMDRFERLRYQSQDRRKQLLDEIIAVELLADEAKRRGLDRDVETQMRLDQALRDEMLRQLRQSLPGPESLPEPEVRAYFDSHKQEYDEPERRRISEIVVGNQEEARRISELARKATAAEWGQLVRSHSVGRRESAQPLPLELEGDLGVVSAPGRSGGNEPQLPDEIIRAAFAIEKVGDVGAEPILVQGKYHIVRLTSRTVARQRSFAEAERSIRVTLVQQRLEVSRRQLLDDLSKQFPVTVNQSVLATIKPTSK